MTHQQNYGNDRLAVYTFDRLFKLFSRATTLQLRGAEPEQLANLYFTKYPKEVAPIWVDPCLDHRHRDIWNQAKQCGAFPSLLVVGPQKSGNYKYHI